MSAGESMRQNNHDQVIGAHEARLDSHEKTMAHLDETLNGIRKDLQELLVASKVMQEKMTSFEQKSTQDAVAIKQIAESQIKLAEGHSAIISRLMALENFRTDHAEEFVSLNKDVQGLMRSKRDLIIWCVATGTIIALLSNLSAIFSWFKSP